MVIRAKARKSRAKRERRSGMRVMEYGVMLKTRTFTCPLTGLTHVQGLVNGDVVYTSKGMQEGSAGNKGRRWVRRMAKSLHMNRV
jgi:hypothetical protein